jgi:alpha-galactosidase
MHKRYIFALASMILVIAYLLMGVGSHVPAAYALNNGLALTPPLGWNSWNFFNGHITTSIIEKEADAMASSGMKAAGYQYINLDEGWWQGTRDSKGNITVNQSQWPGGMQPVVAYIHSKGLKAGTYIDAGINGCGGTNQGSYNHYAQDMLQFEKWGYDYIEVDWCGGNKQGLNPATQYAQVRDAIANATKQTGHSMVFSICDWGTKSPWMWGPTTGNMWRTTRDINDSWGAVIRNLDGDAPYVSSAGPGHWNYADMLEVGNPKLNDTEGQSQFGMWAMVASPLIAGNDLAAMTPATKAILTNSEVLAVDQDKLGIQGAKVADNGAGLQVWSKRLQGSNVYAVALFNRNTTAANITATWKTVGLTTGSASVRELIAHANRGTFANQYTASVPGRGVVLLKVTG